MTMYIVLGAVALFPWAAHGVKRLFPNNSWVKSLI
jgi:hypothetical protein